MRYAIGIVHYGSSEQTVAALESTLHLDSPPAARCVVDNHPARPLTLPPTLEAETLVVRSGQNLGFAGGANLAAEVLIRESDPDALFFLNNDARTRAGTVDRLVRRLVEDPAVAMVGPRILRAGTPRIWHDGARIHWPEGSIEGVRYDEPEPEQALEPFAPDFVCGCAPLIRRTAWEAVGGFDERYFLYYEDTDLSLRLRDRGWRLLHEPEARVEHAPSSGARSPDVLYYQLRNRWLFHQTHAPRTPESTHARGRWTQQTQRRALRYWLTGRWSEARAITQAIRDAKRGTTGRRA